MGTQVGIKTKTEILLNGRVIRVTTTYLYSAIKIHVVYIGYKMRGS